MNWMQDGLDVEIFWRTVVVTKKIKQWNIVTYDNQSRGWGSGVKPIGMSVEFQEPMDCYNDIVSRQDQIEDMFLYCPGMQGRLAPSGRLLYMLRGDTLWTLHFAPQGQKEDRGLRKLFRDLLGTRVRKWAYDFRMLVDTLVAADATDDGSRWKEKIMEVVDPLDAYSHGPTTFEDMLINTFAPTDKMDSLYIPLLSPNFQEYPDISENPPDEFMMTYSVAHLLNLAALCHEFVEQNVDLEQKSVHTKQGVLWMLEASVARVKELQSEKENGAIVYPIITEEGNTEFLVYSSKQKDGGAMDTGSKRQQPIYLMCHMPTPYGQTLKGKRVDKPTTTSFITKTCHWDASWGTVLPERLTDDIMPLQGKRIPRRLHDPRNWLSHGVHHGLSEMERSVRECFEYVYAPSRGGEHV